MIDTKNTLILAGAIILAAALYCFGVPHPKYQIAAGQVGYMIDSTTGEVCLLTPSQKKRLY